MSSNEFNKVWSCLSMKDKKIKLMGYYLDALTLDETVNAIEYCIDSKIKCQHGVLNAGKVVLAEKDHELKRILNECDILSADGMSIVWISKLFKMPLPERVTGIDLMERLIELSSKKAYRVYFFGAREEVVKKTVEAYKNMYPELIVAGYKNGYFSEDNNSDIVQEINRVKPDILFLGFSSPKKEYWINNNKDKLSLPFYMGVGGSFDIIAGYKKRAPVWMQKCGLEWLFRFIQEPGRMWKRYIIGNIKFLFIVLKYKICKKKW